LHHKYAFKCFHDTKQKHDKRQKQKVQGVAMLWLDAWRKLGQVKNATSQTKNSASTSNCKFLKENIENINH
jgi:hypothetical protein